MVWVLFLADMDSVSVVAIAAMMLIMLVWLAFGTLLIVRRYHRPGARAGDMSLFQEATSNEDNPHLPPLQCPNSPLEYRPLHGVHTQVRRRSEGLIGLVSRPKVSGSEENVNVRLGDVGENLIVS